MQRHLITGAMLALVIGAGACTAAQAASPVTEAEARSMAESMLAAYNDGEYAAWSADWSQAMKDAIGGEAFSGFREQTMAAAGEFVAIESVEMRPGQNPGVVRWEFTTAFDNGTYTFMIAFKEGSKLIEGVTLEAAA